MTIFFGRNDTSDKNASRFERMRVEIAGMPEPLILGCDGANKNYEQKIEFGQYLGKIRKISSSVQGYGIITN